MNFNAGDKIVVHYHRHLGTAFDNPVKIERSEVRTEFRSTFYKVWVRDTKGFLCELVYPFDLFELYEEQTVTNYFPCKIRVNNEEESKAVQEWLFEQGARWYSPKGKTINTDFYSPLFGFVVREDLNIGWYSADNPDYFEKAEYPELKFIFKTIVDKAEFVQPVKATIDIDGKTYYKDDIIERLKELNSLN